MLRPCRSADPAPIQRTPSSPAPYPECIISDGNECEDWWTIPDTAEGPQAVGDEAPATEPLPSCSEEEPAATSRSPAVMEEPRLTTPSEESQVLADSQDLRRSNFERQCNLHRIDRGEWVAILSGKLSGKASDAFRTVPEQEIHSYARVKEVLLARYAVTPESYRQKFRDSRKTTKDSYVEWACQLSLSASNWVNSSQATTAEDILQLMLLEQFYNHIQTDVKDWVRDRRPMTLPEAAKLADEYADTRKTNLVTPRVVPRKYRQELLRIGHDVPLAGHLGIRKTGYRITQNFFWPGVSDDVRAYCQTCEVCQRIGKKGDHPKAKLVSMPIIEEPFTRVAVDIIGPLAQPSRSGKRYILTIVDYATRYPEAVALSNIQAETVAEALVKVFSRVGFPKEVLSDQGTQFTAEVTQQIWKTCGVKSLTSSPYHPQTNGLCERFNGTLKQMLKSFTGAYKDWERFLPHLLFAYREVPQESTGFSPFELLYGRRVRGPLDLILLETKQATFSQEPGYTLLAIHKVETPGQAPLRQPPYRIPEAVREGMRKEIDEMLRLGVIEPSESPWASPVVLVPKKDGTTRFCVDYRRLNDKTVTDAYPMPRMDELLDRISAGKYLTTIDLCKGYWQIPLAEDAIPKSAFITPFGLYQFRVMPFGMKNAPATFQRMVDQLLRGLQSFAGAYLDDIAIHSDTWEAHLEHVGVVLDRIRGAGLTLKPDKCHLGMGEVQYLGHRVGCGKQRPEPAKIEAVANWPTPHTKTQVMAFLGTAGYYRRFVPDYSALAKPLTDLTKKKLPRQVLWSPECEVAFQALKTALVNAPVLVTPDPNKRFIVHTDASMFGLGAVLSQIGEDGGEHPVAYLSRKLLPREVSYATIEKECLALVWALKKLTPYLYGRAFTLITDHNPLVWLNRVSGDNARLLRWSLALQP
ncbi:uncharacterized protein LOC121007851, partial [Bufo bufo]|uniref:uncharacterized protein LOC121007851 n=1 Tax=Bufo bufo TaxID=8384 RepID=UPI001ABE14AE